MTSCSSDAGKTYAVYSTAKATFDAPTPTAARTSRGRAAAGSAAGMQSTAVTTLNHPKFPEA